MFCVIYQFFPVPGKEAEFVDCWKQMTELIKMELGGLGSRLHRSDTGEYFAYAQWPDRAHWEHMRTNEESERMASLTAHWRTLAKPGKVIFQGEVVDDLLE